MNKRLNSLCQKSLRKIRTLPSKAFRFLPVSSEIIGPPKGFYNSTREWLTKALPDGSKIDEFYTEIYTSQPISHSKPRTIENDIHWRFDLDLLQELPPAFVAVVPNGRVWDNSAVISPDDQLLADVSKSNAKVRLEKPKHHPVFRQSKLSPLEYFEGTVAVLSVAGGNTYAHWMLDLLPRINLLRHSNFCLADIDYFLVNGTQLPFQKETLANVGIPKEKVIDSSQHIHIKAERLVVPSLPRPTVNVVQWTPKWACTFLGEEILASQAVKKTNKFDKIYISRAKASRRRVLNEAELTDFLSEIGFCSVNLELMSVTEQAELFSSARFIVAPHGAGLVNLVFCKSGTKVIELFPPNYLLVDYWILSNQLGLNYFYLIGKGKRNSKHLYKPQYAEDITVNISLLSNLIGELEKN